MEKWSNVKGYKGRYLISDKGRVFGIYRNKMLALEESDGGYLRVCLVDEDRVKKKYAVHRLVAQAFISNPNKKPHVNHKDGDKKNNDAANLEWVTPSENEFHSYRKLGKVKVGVKGKAHPMSKPLYAHIYDTGETLYFESRNIAAKELGIDAADISRIANGQMRSKRFHFIYQNQ